MRGRSSTRVVCRSRRRAGRLDDFMTVRDPHYAYSAPLVYPVAPRPNLVPQNAPRPQVQRAAMAQR